MPQWNKIAVNKVYLYAPENLSTRRYYYVVDKIGKTIVGVVMSAFQYTTAIGNFSATKENIDTKTDLCTTNTYESNKRTMLMMLFKWSEDSMLEVME